MYLYKVFEMMRVDSCTIPIRAPLKTKTGTAGAMEGLQESRVTDLNFGALISRIAIITP